jgi:hypothetical protein
VPPPPSDLLQPARRKLDRDRFSSCRPLRSVPLRSDRCCFTMARLSLLHRLDSFHSARSRGDTRSPWSCPASGAKKSSGALFSELFGSTVFIQPEAAGTRGAPGAVLRREAGAGAHGTRAGPRAALSQEVGTRAAVTRSAPRAALRGLEAGGGNRSCGDTRRPQSCPARPRSCPEPGGGNRSRGDTRAPPELPCAGSGCCPRSCPEPIYYWLFLVISS